MILLVFNKMSIKMDKKCQPSYCCAKRENIFFKTPKPPETARNRQIMIRNLANC